MYLFLFFLSFNTWRYILQCNFIPLNIKVYNWFLTFYFCQFIQFNMGNMHYIVKFIPQISIKQINLCDVFWNFDQILMDNHKLIMILIDRFFCIFQIVIEIQFYIFIKYAWKVLEFGLMHENKTYFCIFEMRKLFRIFGIFWNFKEEHVFLILGQYLTV